MVAEGPQSQQSPLSSSTMDPNANKDILATADTDRPVTSFSSSVSMSRLVCHRLRTNWKIILLGQGLSFLLASAGAAQATLHLSCGLSAPTFTMALVYLGLSILHLPILFWRKWRRQRWHVGEDGIQMQALDEIDRDNNVPDEAANDNGSDSSNDIASNNNNKPLLVWSLWWYLLLAFFDVEANAVTMLAFRYTTLTSVTLFDALAIPAAMVISRCVVFRSSRRYRPLHYFGVLLCMVGVLLNVFQDYKSDENQNDDEEQQQEYPHKLLGDLCAITGGILYGLNDVLTEVTVSKADDTTEYLGMLGVFGFLISFLQSLLLERDDIREFFDSSNSGSFDDDSSNGGDDVNAAMDTMTSSCSLQSGFLLLFAFVVVTICSYVGGSHFLVLSEAAFFNLSLLTGDLWSVLFSVVAERIVPRPLFFAALVAVLSGVVVYEMAPSPALEKNQQQYQEQYQHQSQQNNWEVGNNDRNNDDEQETTLEHNDYGNGKDGIMVINNIKDHR